MTQFTNPLDNIKIASPCSADWNAMIGNNRQRYCGECRLNVYNLSGMTRREAENLLLEAEGRVCVRYFRRGDGTVLTKDCPVGWQAVKKRMSRFWTATVSLLFTIFGGIGLTNYILPRNNPILGQIAVKREESPDIIPVNENTNIEVEENPVEVMGAIPVFDDRKNSNFNKAKRKITKKYGY